MLPHGIDVDRGKRLDGLAGRRDDAADFVELVAEEVEADGIDEVAGEHVDGAAAHAERPGAVELAGVGISAIDERLRQVLELGDAGALRARHVGKLRSRGERDGQKHLFADGRERAEERPGARDDDHVAAFGERMRRRHALGDAGGIGRFRGEHVVGALGEAHDALLPQVRGDLLREGDRRLLPDDDERRLRPVGEPRGGEERTRGVGDAQRGIRAFVELAPERLEASRALQGERQRIDEHVLFPPSVKPRASQRSTAPGRESLKPRKAA